MDDNLEVGDFFPVHDALREAVKRHAPHVKPIHEAVVLQPGLKSYAHMAAVVKVGSETVVKYGPHVSATEFDTLTFIEQTTSVPVPHVLGIHQGDDGNTYIVMSFVSGMCLLDVWDSLISPQKDRIGDQLGSQFRELHSIRRECIGSLTGGPCKDIYFDETLNRGPFATEEAMNSAIVEGVKAAAGYASSFVAVVLSSLPVGHAIVFSHGNLNMSHVIVDDKCESVTAIVGWQRSGFFPEHWDFVNALTLTIAPFRSDWVEYVENFLEPYYEEYPLWCQLRMTARWRTQLEGR